MNFFKNKSSMGSQPPTWSPTILCPGIYALPQWFQGSLCDQRNTAEVIISMTAKARSYIDIASSILPSRITCPGRRQPWSYQIVKQLYWKAHVKNWDHPPTVELHLASHLREVDSPTPVKPSSDYSPSQHLTATSWENVSQKYPAKMLPNPCP